MNKIKRTMNAGRLNVKAEPNSLKREIEDLLVDML